MTLSVTVRAFALAALTGLVITAGASEAAAETLLLRMPAISRDHIAFVYAGDIWVAGRDGASPRRLTVHPGIESLPAFSPDGQMIAFTGRYEGNADVYVVALAGGQPKRLTFHPQGDAVRGWTPAGDGVLFTSPRELTYQRGGHLWRVAVGGGYPERLPMPVAFDGAYSPDGARIAYQPIRPAYSGASGWKRYRGGTTPAIWLFDLKSHEIERIPHDRVNDTLPMWVGDTVYFLSDRNRIVNIFAYRSGDESPRQITHGEGWDIGWANATDDAIIYEMGGRLYELDLADEQSRPIPITINPDLPETRAHWVKGDSFIREAGLSPSGARAVFAARGDILTVPAKKGDIRNLTRSTAVHDRDPLWSPDGKSIAYLSDVSGEYELVVRDQDGKGDARRLTLGEPAFYNLLAWSPDGGRIVYSDNHLNIFALDLDTAERTLIDSHVISWLRSSFEVALAPDSRWLAYTKVLSNQMSALMIHDFETGASHQVTEGMSEAEAPVFSRDGKYLFFTASTNYGPHASWLDMSSQERPARRGIYAAVLAADGETPLPPESDEEGDDGDDDNDNDEAGDKNGDDGDDDEADGKDGEEKKIEPVIIDFEGLRNRIVALPVAERNYTSLAVAKDGSLFYLEIRPSGVSSEPPGSERSAVNTLRRFDFEDREGEVFKADVASFSMSGDGSKLLVRGAKSSWSIIPTDKKKSDKAETLALGGMRIHVEPKAEWRHIFGEAWRQMRDFFYDPGMHGADWPAVRDKYSPLVDHVGRREDLNVILVDMIGELVVGHARIFGGDFVKNGGVPTGLLGADYALENGRYRVARVYTGESWNPFLKAPLAVPGATVSAGEYILAINGRELTADDNIHALLEGTVGKQTVLSVAADANGEGARDVTVEPIASERLLRRWDWIEANRHKVDEATGGRVGYVYLPNTGGAGFTYFNRFFYTQLDKDALIVDERGNGGGQAANYIVDQLTRTYTASWKLRDGALWSTPVGIIPGPKVMLIDMFAGSGGDFLPYSFKSRGGGKLVGTRTWGGLVGGGPGPALIDGGRVNLPTLGFIHPEGRWAIENEGVAPDIEVEMLPKAVIAGGDPQLEKAIEVMLQELEEWQPIMLKEAPPFPTTARD